MDNEILEALGISQPALDEIISILGHLPNEEELSTLLAMWESNGKQQSLFGWLKGQPKSIERQSYFYTGSDRQHNDIPEPKIQDCVIIAKQLAPKVNSDYEKRTNSFNRKNSQKGNKDQSQKNNNQTSNLYLVGSLSTLFLGSDYSNTCLHLAVHPQEYASHEEEHDYLTLILDALRDNGIISHSLEISHGGLFCALLSLTSVLNNAEVGSNSCSKLAQSTTTGFDILTCREVRLDAFLFGEEPGRFVVSLDESQDDMFLQKLDEARVDACFLGRTTNGRILIDGFDFGNANEYTST